ncbi:hypothetical protein [Microbulbifer halophilus]
MATPVSLQKFGWRAGRYSGRPRERRPGGVGAGAGYWPQRTSGAIASC